ncbi:MAG: ArsR/SmtB family transcription factor [Deltaproteobacteria bacterium]
MTQPTLGTDVLPLIAERLKALAEPARLQILNVIRDRESTVSEIVGATGLGQTNVSKHLQLLHAHGFVSRRKDGLFVYYAVADRLVFELCELMCDSLDETVATRRRILAS